MAVSVKTLKVKTRQMALDAWRRKNRIDSPDFIYFVANSEEFEACTFSIFSKFVI